MLARVRPTHSRLGGALVVEPHSADAGSGQAGIKQAKSLGKRVLRAAGVAVHAAPPAGSRLRPIGMTRSVLEDIRTRGFAPRLIFDVGASNGSWSQMASRVFPGARIVLVDPRPDAAPALTEFCRSSDRFSAELVAVGPE